MCEIKHLCQSEIAFGELGIKLLLLQNVQYLLQVLEVLLPCLSIDQDVIKKHWPEPPWLPSKDVVHARQKCGGSIGQPKGHD